MKKTKLSTYFLFCVTSCVDGNVEIFKEKVEIDEANKWVSLTALEGNVLEQYKSYKIIFQVTSKSEGGGLVKITIHYGKLNDNDPPPHIFALRSMLFMIWMPIFLKNKRTNQD
ncbi:unnamed protein product [Prunus armeniaca]